MTSLTLLRDSLSADPTFDRLARTSTNPHTGQTATTSDCNSREPVKCQHYQENPHQIPGQRFALLATETNAVSSIFLCSPEIIVSLISSHGHRSKAIIEGCSNRRHWEKPESGNPKSQIVWGFSQVCERWKQKFTALPEERLAPGHRPKLGDMGKAVAVRGLLSVFGNPLSVSGNKDSSHRIWEHLQAFRSGHLMRKYRLTYHGNRSQPKAKAKG